MNSLGLSDSPANDPFREFSRSLPENEFGQGRQPTPDPRAGGQLLARETPIPSSDKVWENSTDRGLLIFRDALQ
jgi:hypothetical protein